MFFYLLSITLILATGPAIHAADGVGNISVDYRGLVSFGEGLSTNLIAFGPGWKYAAQDHSLKNIKKTGKGGNLQYEADFNIPGAKVKLVQTTKVVKNNDRTKGLKLNYILSSDNPFSLENAFLAIRVPTAVFLEGTVTADGETFTFPQTLEKEYLPFPSSASQIVLANKQTMLKIQGDNFRTARVDMRQHKTNNFEIRIQFPNTKNTTSTSISFEVINEAVPFTITADENWIPLPVSRGIEPGSILDFSFMSDAPAGKYGRIISSSDGHLVYEKKPDQRVKLVGTNLCFGANYLAKKDADRLAQTFRRMGYNTIRFHHTDVDMIRGAWNAKQSDDIDPAQLDKIDYLFAAMKNAGMYVSIDLFSMRRFGADEIEGWNEYVDNPDVIKALVPILPGAFDAWTKMSLKWLNHTNPYTGMAMKDDPALLSICPLNEDSIFSVWQASDKVKQLYLTRFEQWKRQNSRSGDHNQLMSQFLIELKMESNRQMEKFFRDNGVNAMLTGSNWWNTMAQTFTRSQFDLVDNHQYWDHPMPHYLPSKYNQRSNMRESKSYIVPCFMMPTRIFGKPFTVSEYNFCAPNQYRAEAGAMMGAYSALQDWDGLYRFSWSHSSRNITETRPIEGFDIATDPLSLLTERQVVLMFGRGDIAPAKERYVYAVTMHEATKSGVGDMWSKGLFPRRFTMTGLVSQVGSQAVGEGHTIQGNYDTVVAANELPENVLSGNQMTLTSDLPKVPAVGEEIVSDTQQLFLNNKKGYVKVVSDRTECIVAPAGIDLAGSQLSIRNSDAFASISASAMDDQVLAESSRVLLLHLTNVLNTNMQFSNEKMTKLLKRGELPYLVHVGSADLTLKNTNPDLTLYVLDFSGRRIREVQTNYVDGAYQFKAQIDDRHLQPALIYELAKQ